MVAFKTSVERHDHPVDRRNDAAFASNHNAVARSKTSGVLNDHTRAVLVRKLRQAVLVVAVASEPKFSSASLPVTGES